MLSSLLIKLYLLSEKHQMEQLTDIAQYHGIVERYRRPRCFANDYLQTRAEGLIADGVLEALCFDDNAYLLEHKDGV